MMKKLFFMVLVMLITPLYAQDNEEILLGGDVEHGGYGGPHMSLSEVNGDLGILTGISGGWIINHTYVVGLGSYTLQNEVQADLNDYYLEMNYGGLHLAYILNSDHLFHYYFQTLIGSGTVNYADEITGNDWSSGNDWFWTVQPGAYVEMNVVNFFRVGVGLNYRYVSGIQLTNLSNRDVNGMSFTLNFKFGKF